MRLGSSHSQWNDDYESVKHHQGCEEAQKEHPEPQENVNFLIDNVYGQDAQGIMALNVSRGSKLMKGALGHSGKDVNDRIHSVLGVSEGKRDNFNAKSEKGPVQESVHKEKLTYR